MKHLLTIILLMTSLTWLSAQTGKDCAEYAKLLVEGDDYIKNGLLRDLGPDVDLDADESNGYAPACQSYYEAKRLAKYCQLPYKDCIEKLKNLMLTLEKDYGNTLDITEDKDKYEQLKKKYDYILPFGKYLYKAYRDNTDYLIDYNGEEYKVAYRLEDMREDITALCIEHSVMDSFPVQISAYPQLRALYLHHNFWQAEQVTLPVQLAKLSNLEFFILDKCPLKVFPEVLLDLKQLKVLDLSYTELSTLPDSISQLSHLIELNLDGSRYYSGTSLRLYENKLSRLPESFGQLKALRRLNLNGNQLSSLPVSFGQLSSLEYLDLEQTTLRSLPESIGQLTNLKALDLKYTNISTLPESIGNLTKLEVLILPKSLTSLPESIGKLVHIINLDLSSTHLKVLPTTIVNMKGLRRLSLPYSWTSLPESIAKLTDLDGLGLPDLLTSLPESIGQLTNLKELGIKYTQVSSLPESIGQLTNLQELDLEYTDVSTLPESIGNLTKLEVLILPKSLTSLPESIGHLDHIISLDLSSTQLKVLPTTIVNMKGLRRLSLPNSWTSLPESITKLTNLEVLCLPNDLTSFPRSIKRLTNLDVISLGRRYKLSRAKINRIKRLLPKCNVKLHLYPLRSINTYKKLDYR